jgi:hypothetical protein
MRCTARVPGARVTLVHATPREPLFECASRDASDARILRTGGERGRP